MPLLELTGAGLVKLAGAKSAASSFWLPPVQLASTKGLAASSIALTPAAEGTTQLLPTSVGSGLWSGLQSLGSHASSALADSSDWIMSLPQQSSMLSLRSITTAAVATGALKVLHDIGLFDELFSTPREQNEEDENDEDSRRKCSFNLTMPLKVTIVSDCFMAGVLVNSLGLPLELPLRTWAAGGLLLSFPLSYLVKCVVKRLGTRWGCVVELLATAASFAWLTWGTLMLSGHPLAVHQAPLLWWSCFAQCILSWSVVCMGIHLLIACTVISTIFGSGAGTGKL